MLAALSLALLLSDFDGAARAFTSALVRDDLKAVSGTAPIVSPLGTARDMLQIYDDVAIHSYRVASAEARPESTFLVLEIEGDATAIGTGARATWPRWWSLEVKPGSNELVSAMTLERRLAYENVLKSGEELDALLRAHPEIDVERFLISLANAASDDPDHGCNTILWILRESKERALIGAEANGWQMLSFLATLTWNGPEALWPAERSLRIAEVAGAPDLLADSLFSMGIAHWIGGRLDEAVDALARSASLAEQDDDPRLPVRSAYMASYLELTRNRLREALALAERHRELLARYPHARGTVDNAFQLATIHERLGNTEIARHYYDIARSVARTSLHDLPLEAMAVYDIAEIDLRTGAPGGRALLEEAYAIGKTALSADLFTTIQRKLAYVRMSDGDFDGAKRLFEEMQPPADASIDPSVTAAFYRGRSTFLLEQGLPAEALADARKSVALTKPEIPLASALTVEARALRRLGRNDEAEAAWRAAIDFSELDLAERSADETGSAEVLRWLLDPYRELLDLMVDEGCAREALTIAEGIRARSLRESLRHGRVDLLAGLDEAARTQLREREAALSAANRQLLAATDAEAIERLRRERDDARMSLRQYRSELSLSHPGLGRRQPEPSRSNGERLPVIPPGEIVLELAVTDDAVFAFVVEDDRVEARRLGISRAALEKKIDVFVAALEQRDLAYREPARELYELLLGPLGSRLASAGRIRVVPDGALWRVPFQALIDGQGRHLAERVAVAYSPSLASSRTGSARENAPRTLFALADPAIGTATAAATRSLYRDVSLGRLPDAAAEAKSIARLYSGARVHIGAAAQESAFKSEAPAYRVLHLATHSIVDDGAPMFSSIVLAASSAHPLDDGLLEAREIADLDLHADLAVLSACETARGTITPGEGVIGLSWAFLAAGVPTTVVSQWKVGSASTADLMVRFHRHLRGGATPAAALRTAMLELRRHPRWQHPFYWAPFVVIENGAMPAERQ